MKCDKCGLEVQASNDATVVQALAYNEPAHCLFYGARHFLPVLDANGNVLCEGSPSRAQYIEGQPRDTRGYAYDETQEARWRNAWATLQANPNNILK